MTRDTDREHRREQPPNPTTDVSMAYAGSILPARPTRPIDGPSTRSTELASFDPGALPRLGAEVAPEPSSAEPPLEVTLADFPGIGVGATLICADFGEVEPGFTLLGEVMAIRGEHLELYLRSQRRRWRIRASALRTKHSARVQGQWIHRPEDYPPPGRDEAFDREYRTTRAAYDAPPGAPVGWQPPRPARPGYVWARTAASYFECLGYDLAGTARTGWGPGMLGELPEAALGPAIAERL